LAAQESSRSVPADPFSTLASLGIEDAGTGIEFAVTNYDFGKVKAGEMVKYTFIFTNTGSVALEVSEVRPSCGCTTAGDWTKKADPGRTGMIPVQFDSGKFNGTVHKTVTVSSNDKHRPSVVLQLSGTVWKPIEIIPPYVVLYVRPEATNASTNVRLISNLEEPMTISDLVSSRPGTTVTVVRTNNPGKEYLLSISASPPFSGGTGQAKVTLRTSSAEMPIVEIPFWANVIPAISVSPAALILPEQRPLGKIMSSLIIQNNTAKPMSLTEAAVNFPGVEFLITETSPGKVCSVQFSFPAGFELPLDRSIAFSVQTGNPLLPLISVPILGASAQTNVLQSPEPPALSKRDMKFRR
jgi:hypothetical protein